MVAGNIVPHKSYLATMAANWTSLVASTAVPESLQVFISTKIIRKLPWDGPSVSTMGQ